MKRYLPFLSLLCSFATAFGADSAVVKASAEIDQLLQEGYERLEIEPNPQVGDDTFVRRAFLAIAGRIPTAAEAEAFLKDTNPQKRADLIDLLVNSDGFNHHLFNFYADLLRLDTRSRMSGLGWHLWLKDAVVQNRPYDEIVYDMLAATGHVSENPAVGYYLRDRNMILDNVSNSVQIFLGMRIGCAQCHDDPFNETTQMDYFRLAAFSGGMDFDSPFSKQRHVGMVTEYASLHNLPFDRKQFGKKRAKKPEFEPIKKVEKDIAPLFAEFGRVEVIETDQDLKLPHDYAYDDGEPSAPVEPDTLFGARLNLTDYPNRKAAFASWLTSTENERFAKNIANRLWDHVFGIGLRMPLDDWEETDRAHHPKVLDHVTSMLIASDFDVRATLRVLYHTQLFQREVGAEEVPMGGRHDFSGPVLRRLTALELFDSLQTIQHGNIDATQHPRLREIWKSYVTSAQTLKTATTERLFELDEALDQASLGKHGGKNLEKELKAALSEARRNQDEAKADELQAQIMQLKRNPYGAMMTGDAALIQPVTRGSANFGPAGNGFRSSELPAPFLPGSLVRQFGGSDRETPNASHTKPSIPQMLAILNGENTINLTGKKGKLLPVIFKSKQPSERLDQLFLTLYATYPTDSERAVFEPLMENPKDAATVARAILTSNRFLFVR